MKPQENKNGTSENFHCVITWISSTGLIINRLAVVIFYFFMLELIKFNIMPRVWLQCALHFLSTWFLKETFCECKWNELRQNCTTVKPGCQSVLSQCTVLCFVHFCLVPYIAIVFYLIWLTLPGLFWLSTSFLNTIQIQSFKWLWIYA